VSPDNAKALLREIRDTLSLSLVLDANSGLIKVRVGMCNRSDLGIEVWLADLLDPLMPSRDDPALDAALERELIEVVAALGERTCGGQGGAAPA
jgi:hypothetical protein